MIPTDDILRAGLKQLTVKWAGNGGVARVLLQVIEGKPVYYFIGPTVAPPAGLPGQMTLPDPARQPYVVPIYWRQDVPAVGIDKGYLAPGPTSPLPTPPVRPVTTSAEGAAIFDSVDSATRPMPPVNNEDLDRAYWHFATPTVPRPVEVVHPAFNVVPVPILGPIPPPDAEDKQLSVDMRLPQYDLPNFWAKPFEPQGCLCCTFYEQSVLIFSYVVPADYLLVVDGWSFTVPTDMAQGEIIEVQFLRDGAELLRYEEVVVDPAAVDPANRLLFSTPQEIQQILMLFDRNSRLDIRITLKGTFPFAKTPADPFCGTICLLLHGWLGSLMDNRDGAPRPVDVGSIRDFDPGMELPEITPARLDEIEAWLESVAGYVR